MLELDGLKTTGAYPILALRQDCTTAEKIQQRIAKHTQPSCWRAQRLGNCDFGLSTNLETRDACATSPGSWRGQRAQDIDRARKKDKELVRIPISSSRPQHDHTECRPKLHGPSGGPIEILFTFEAKIMLRWS